MLIYFRYVSFYTNRQEPYFIQKRFFGFAIKRRFICTSYLYWSNNEELLIHFLSDLTENFKYITHPYAIKINC